MSSNPTCPGCGRELPGEAGMRGTCPHCLLGLGLEPTGQPDGGSPLTAGQPLPTSIGPYRLKRKVGEGGMGIVYEAEQTEPIRRRVAIKVIKHGMGIEQVVARFEAERQALAVMDHPAVARVFDAGSTPDGRPYFAMEFVEGVPITEYCDREQLSMQRRLELFSVVCEGVQHAHQKAIIHRDLKPSNILVTTQAAGPFPKIIDFGVSKATEREASERSLYTEQGVLIGTPAYMSPEQADPGCVDIDTRTDVYSLGVVLYELLVGALPFDPEELRAAGLDAIAEKIRGSDPPRPSSRVGRSDERSLETARRRRADLQTLVRLVRGDLDWIVMKALEKERDRRYTTPQDLADDIRHHLNHEPVVAGPPSASYRARKFVRRHRLGVVFAATAAVMLVAFAATMTLLNTRISRERDRANRESESAEGVSTFLGDMMSDLEPPALGQSLWEDLRARVRRDAEKNDAGPEQIDARLADFDRVMSGVNPVDAALRLIDEEILARAGDQIDSDEAIDPDIALRLRATLGGTYRSLQLPEQARSYFATIVETHGERLGDDHPQTMNALRELADIDLMLGQLVVAEESLRRVGSTLSRTLGSDHPDTLLANHRLGMTLLEQGRFNDADPLLTRSVEDCRRVHGEDHLATLTSLRGLGMLRRQQGRFEESEAACLAALEGFRRTLGDDADGTRHTVYDLGILMAQRGRNADAEPYLREDLANRRRRFGNDNAATLGGVINLGAILRRQGKFDEAEPLYREGLEGQIRLLGRDHPNTLTAMNNMGVLQENLGNTDAAIALYTEALERRRVVLGNEHRMTLQNMGNLGQLLRAAGRLDESEPLMMEALATSRSALGPDHPETIDMLNRTSLLLMDQRRFAEAETLIGEAMERSLRVLGEGERVSLAAVTNRGHVLRFQGRYAEAVEAFELAVDRCRRAQGDEHPRTLRVVSAWGDALRRARRIEEADPIVSKALDDALRVLGDDHPMTLRARIHMAHLRADQGRTAEARELYETLLPQLRERYPEGDLRLREVIAALASITGS